MYSVESYFLQKKRIGKKETNQSYCKHRQKYKHCPEKQWNVTWVYSIKILTWLQEADNDSCGWYVTKKKERGRKQLSFLYPVVLQVVCFWGQVVHVVKTMCVSTNMRSQCLNILLQRKKARDKRCQIWCKVNRTKQQTWIKQQLQILSFSFCRQVPTYLTGNLPLGPTSGCRVTPQNPPKPRLVKTN